MPGTSGPKDAQAFRTIGEVSADLGIAQHILRYWETRFPQLKPLQRAGNRRYYRPEDVALVARIDQLLNREGYTVKGVQQLLRSGAAPSPAVATPPPADPRENLVEALKRVRTTLSKALSD
ncbi:MerR family transcriptional regulator [Sphingomonas sp. LHG3406-1]|uniref:MerR family transcriptional regulator n=1 Tax=Sphingomonas sp. LHG3406-1 TaxID=2804617 RepID=UPI002629A625|nr:MerR family transcriptional regulator [Sphingomonas sp. LHG3406-1]